MRALNENRCGSGCAVRQASSSSGTYAPLRKVWKMFGNAQAEHLCRPDAKTTGKKQLPRASVVSLVCRCLARSINELKSFQVQGGATRNRQHGCAKTSSAERRPSSAGGLALPSMPRSPLVYLVRCALGAVPSAGLAELHAKFSHA